jgi:hypothetical protein
MTTPRDLGAPSAEDNPANDEETRVGQAVTPAFPSVGGQSEAPARPPSTTELFSRADLEPAAGTPDDVAPPVALAQTGPVVAGSGNGRWRWVAAGLATVLVVAVVVGLFIFLGSRPATPSLVAQFAPADTTAYVELRMDLPGDQRDRLATFMSHFPGFADPASFQQKIDDTLAKALESSGTGLDWNTDIEPWFGGMVGVFAPSFRPPAQMAGAMQQPPPFTLVLSVKDRTRLDELISAHATDAGVEQQDYKGQTIWTANVAGFGPGMDETDQSPQRVSYAVTDEAFVVSLRIEDLQKALDTKTGEATGLADDSFFTAQLSALHADHLALLYYDYGNVIDSMPEASSMPGLLPPECMAALTSGTAQLKLIGELRAENDHLALNVRAQPPSVEGLPVFTNENSTLLQSFPATTVAYLEYPEVGATIRFYVEKLLGCLPSDSGIPFDPSQLEQFLGTSPQNYFDFVKDAALGVTLTDGKFSGGLIATVDDENLARTRVERILSALRLAGMGGTGITISEEQHGDATVTVIDLGSALGPGEPAPPLAVTVTNGRLYLGLNDFVNTALDQTQADSLASAPRVQSALGTTGQAIASLVYVDIGALRGYFEVQQPAGTTTDYDSNVKPYLEPLTHLVAVGQNDNGIYASHVFLYVE